MIQRLSNWLENNPNRAMCVFGVLTMLGHYPAMLVCKIVNSELIRPTESISTLAEFFSLLEKRKNVERIEYLCIDLTWLLGIACLIGAGIRRFMGIRDRRQQSPIEFSITTNQNQPTDETEIE